MEKDICCEEFAKQMLNIDNPISFAGGGFLYPAELQPDTQGELDDNTGLWNVNGCCGGGCFVLTGLRFCPWCGKELSNLKGKNNE